MIWYLPLTHHILWLISQGFIGYVNFGAAVATLINIDNIIIVGRAVAIGQVITNWVRH